MRIGSTLAVQLRFQCFRELTADGEALPGQAPLQQVERGVELTTVKASRSMSLRAVPMRVDLVHQPLEARQTGRVGYAGAAEKHHTAFLVRLQ